MNYQISQTEKYYSGIPAENHENGGPKNLVAQKKYWIVTADMGYGHLRAVYPLRDLAEEGIISVGDNDGATTVEKNLWSKMLRAYEILSRARSIPVIGKPIFTLLDTFLHIPSFYPIRNLSSTTFQVNLLTSFIRKGLCS
ncbi:MAG TPA: hypothetical protein VKI62_00535, partial [Bacteroidota bacterium]|nr:hypothetical protein [Bacteroidota bacterium]